MVGENACDVIMVGGGVMGCATAYYLLKNHPQLKVAIIEKDPTYEFSSTVLSDANIRLQFNVEENIRISQYGLEVLETFAEDMTVGDDRPDIAFRQQGNLFLTDEAGKEASLSGLETQQSLGCPVEWLSPAADWASRSRRAWLSAPSSGADSTLTATSRSSRVSWAR